MSTRSLARGGSFAIGAFLVVSISIPLGAFLPSDRVSTLAAGARAPVPAKRRALTAVGRQPLRFEAVDSVADRAAGFLSRGSGYALFLGQGAAVVSLSGRSRPSTSPGSSGAQAAVVRMAWPAADGRVQPVGLEPTPGVSNYLVGNDPSRWRRGVQSFGKVRYPNLYAGIDLVFYGNQDQLEYDFVVAPGADPRAIRLRFSGEDEIRIDAQGNLVIRAGAGEIVQLAPVVYQERDGARQVVPGRYVKRGRHEVGFAVGGYDTAATLYIDPVLRFSSFFGGSGNNYAKAVAVDAAGNAYVTGYTASIDFPTTPGAYRRTCATCSFSQEDVFVTKLGPTGVLQYSTYVGDANTDDKAYGIAVDSAGNAYVTGETYHPGSGSTFPVVGGFTVTPGSGAFLFKLDPTGGSLVYSTLMISGSSSIGYGVAVEGSNAYVAGMTVGTSSFPMWPTAGTWGGRVGGATGSYDGFVVKIDTSQTGTASLAYATRFGGWDWDYAYAIAVNASGEAFVTGSTTSNDFPTAGSPAQPTCGTAANCNARVNDVFVSKFNAAGTGLVYSTFAGGSNSDTGYAIAIDPTGSASVAGVTFSPDFPVTSGAFDTSCGNDGSCEAQSDAFVFRLSPAGSAFVYSTYLGGRSTETARGITVDSAGNAYVVGDTSSVDFPVTADAIQPARAGTNTDAFTVAVWSDGALAYSSYLGGSGNVSGGDKAFGIAIDPVGDAWVVGQTDSADFPVQPGAIQTTHSAGQFDGFVVKIGGTGAFPDFNGDGKADLVWRNGVTGQNVVWFMDGTTFLGQAPLPGVADTQWQMAAVADFNGDGMPDLLWRHRTTGQNVVWYLDGVTFVSQALLPAVADTAWQVAAAVDLNGDGRPDLLWRNRTTGQNVVWYLDGVTYLSQAMLPPVADTAWQMVAAADFNGDGWPDLLWRNATTGQNVVWLMNGATFVSQTVLPAVADPAWRVGAVVDLDGDGQMDVVWRNQTTGQNVLWQMNGATFVSQALLPPAASPWDFPNPPGTPGPAGTVPGDFDGNGTSDLVWRNASTGQNVVWFMNQTTFVSQTVLSGVADTAWQIVATGDFNADGKPDLVWRNASTGQNVVWFMSGTAFVSQTVLSAVADTAWQIVAAADFNADGKPDLVWRNRTTGLNVVWLMNGTTFVSQVVLPSVADAAWQIMAAGDFNADGKPDLVWRNTSTGQNVAWLMNGTAFASQAVLPAVGDVAWQLATTGDFNRDGNLDIVWRNYTTGQNVVWLMNQTTFVSQVVLPGVADTNWKLPRNRN